MSTEPIYGPMPEPVAPESTEPPTVRETATVTVSKAVDGTKRKRKRARKSSTAHRPHRKVAAKDTHAVTVDPRVMEAAKSLVRDNTRLVIVDSETVRIVNR